MITHILTITAYQLLTCKRFIVLNGLQKKYFYSRNFLDSMKMKKGFPFSQSNHGSSVRWLNYPWGNHWLLKYSGHASSCHLSILGNFAAEALQRKWAVFWNVTTCFRGNYQHAHLNANNMSISHTLYAVMNINKSLLVFLKSELAVFY